MDASDLILISVDDRVIEPPTMFDNHIPARYRDEATRLYGVLDRQLAVTNRRRKQEVEAQRHSQQDCGREAGEFEKPVSDAARGNKQERQHHAHTEL